MGAGGIRPLASLRAGFIAAPSRIGPTALFYPAKAISCDRRMRPLITLTTDFGAGSPYVAQMKGVILSLCRDIELIDISHTVSPQAVREGAIVLADATTRFPHGTIHVAVVDPGVGTSRRMIYAEIGGQRY